MGRGGGKELLGCPFSKNFPQGLVNFNVKVQTAIYGIVHPHYKEALKLCCLGILCQITAKLEIARELLVLSVLRPMIETVNS